MTEGMGKPGSGIDLTPIASSASASPKGMYTFFLLALCRNYFEEMRNCDPAGIENATAALIAFVPDKEKRVQLWELYDEIRKSKSGGVPASVIVTGELISYLADVLDFTESSTGGLM